jgi:SAM-dependent methyltransferase
MSKVTVAETGEQTTAEAMAIRRQRECPVCGQPGTVLYHDLPDRVFDTLGSWDYARCSVSTCGVMWMDPVVTEEDISKAYRTYYTHADASRGTAGGIDPPRLRPLLGVLRQLRTMHLHHLGYGPAPSQTQRLFGTAVEALLTTLPGVRDALDDTACHLRAPEPGARVLELGFGSGQQLRRMKALGWTVTGVDIDPVVVDAARAKGLDAHLGQLAEQRFPEASFDAIYMSHVIEHVHSPVDLLAECYRILKPGGRLVALTPNTNSWGHRVFRDSCNPLFDPPRHLVLFSPDALRTAAARTGFTDVDVRTSARITFITWAASTDIKLNGKVKSFEGAMPLGRLARGAIAQVSEAARLTVQRDLGEELLCRARKPAA